MTEWWQDPKLWITAGGIVMQAAIVWWRVGEQSVRITVLERDVDSLREYRAQAREQIRQLQHFLRDRE